MGQRRQFRNNEKERYHEINKEIHNDCRKAKENYINSQCNEIEKWENSSGYEKCTTKQNKLPAGQRAGMNVTALKTKVEKFFLMASK